MDSDSYSRGQLDDLYMKMISYYEGDPKRIQHLTKVHSYARLIGRGEQLDEGTLFTLEAAAYTHDIGIKVAEEKYGRSDGRLQEQRTERVWEGDDYSRSSDDYRNVYIGDTLYLVCSDQIIAYDMSDKFARIGSYELH